MIITNFYSIATFTYVIIDFIYNILNCKEKKGYQGTSTFYNMRYFLIYDI